MPDSFRIFSFPPNTASGSERRGMFFWHKIAFMYFFFFWNTFTERNIDSVCTILKKGTGLFLRVLFHFILCSTATQWWSNASMDCYLSLYRYFHEVCIVCVSVCWPKLQFNTATVNVPEAHLEPRSQFKTLYSALPCSRVFVCERFLLANPTLLHAHWLLWEE